MAPRWTIDEEEDDCISDSYCRPHLAMQMTCCKLEVIRKSVPLALSQAKVARLHPVQPLCAGILLKEYSRSGFPSPLEARHQKSMRARRGKSALAVSSVV